MSSDQSYSRWRERLAQWVAMRLPRDVAYWALIRVASHAARVEPFVEVPTITVIEAMEAWDVPS